MQIVNTAVPLAGAGEAATLVIAMIVSNALCHATGQRFDRLPPGLAG